LPELDDPVASLLTVRLVSSCKATFLPINLHYAAHPTGGFEKETGPGVEPKPDGREEGREKPESTVHSNEFPKQSNECIS
jgi:hypothetical protein